MPNPYTKRATIAKAYEFKREMLGTIEAEIRATREQLELLRNRRDLWSAFEGVRLAALVDCYTPEEQAEVMRRKNEFMKQVEDLWIEGHWKALHTGECENRFRDKRKEVAA